MLTHPCWEEKGRGSDPLSSTNTRTAPAGSDAAGAVLRLGRGGHEGWQVHRHRARSGARIVPTLRRCCARRALGPDSMLVLVVLGGAGASGY